MTEPRTFADEIQRMLRAHPGFKDLLPEQAGDDGDIAPITVKRATMSLPVTCCLMTDTTGVNHCQHPPITYPRPPWPKRTRVWIRSRWNGLRYRLGSWIAGVDLDREEDD